MDVEVVDDEIQDSATRNYEVIRTLTAQTHLDIACASSVHCESLRVVRIIGGRDRRTGGVVTWFSSDDCLKIWTRKHRAICCRLADSNPRKRKQTEPSTYRGLSSVSSTKTVKQSGLIVMAMHTCLGNLNFTMSKSSVRAREMASRWAEQDAIAVLTSWKMARTPQNAIA